MRTTTRYTPGHPIVFVFDHGNPHMLVPEYDEAALVSHNDTCVSIRTIADVDGDVEVILSNCQPTAEWTPSFEAFVGTVASPTGRVSVVDSENQVLLGMSVGTGGAVNLRIFVDDLGQASRIWVAAT